jgi:hypothetical protein
MGFGSGKFEEDLVVLRHEEGKKLKNGIWKRDV